MANNISEVLYEIQKMTKENIKLLDMINESFYSNKDYVSSIINGNKYSMPSFLHIESRLNILEENFKNLINAPQTGDASFVFDGNTQSIEMKRFSTTPTPLTLSDVNKFNVVENGHFNNFINPQCFLSFDVSQIPNDISHVIIKKIRIINDNLNSFIKSNFNDDKSFANTLKLINNYKNNVDYIEYEELKRLPAIENTAYGNYNINSIISQNIDSNFIQHYILKLDEELKYYTHNGTIQKSLTIGDILLCNKDMVKLRIDNIIYSERKIEVTVLNNAFVNFDDENLKLTYFTNVDKLNKYVDVSIDSNHNFLVFIAPLNNMNVQSSFGDGVFVDINSIQLLINSSEDSSTTTQMTYSDFYKKYVNNITNTFTNITKMFKSDIFQSNSNDIQSLIEMKPDVNHLHVKVVQINSHLNNSNSIKSIRRFYNEKQSIKSQIESKQNELFELQSQLKSSIYNNTSTGIESTQNQLNIVQSDIKLLNSNLIQNVDAITNSINNSDIYIENPKYHIRGFFDVKSLPNSHKIIKIITQYKYENVNQNVGNIITINNSNDSNNVDFVYSDWNMMYSPILQKNINVVDNEIVVEYPQNNDNMNEISFNQIDIPISQGENVRIKIAVQYEDGYPFVEFKSLFSDEILIEFPQEFTQNISIMDIINDNNRDVNEYKFTSILDKYNIINHVNDSINDQGKIFFHNCENINSGFYTQERRNIPLGEKLRMMDATLSTIENDIYNLNNDNDIEVTLSDGNSTILLNCNETSTFVTQGYSSNINNRDVVVNNNQQNSLQSTPIQNIDNINTNSISNLELKITNVSNHNINLYSLFPGATNKIITENTPSRFDYKYYTNLIENELINTKTYNGVWMYSQSTSNFDETFDDKDKHLCLQHLNQFIYFRLNDVYDNTSFYESYEVYDKDNKLSSNKNYVRKPYNNFDNGASLLPILPSLSNLTLNNNNRYILKPNQSIIINLEFKYLLTSDNNKNNSIEKTMSFDLRTSLYNDPLNYTFSVKAYYYDSILPKQKFGVSNSISHQININND